MRKLSHFRDDKKQYFIGEDNKAYVCDTAGWQGVKEVYEFQKKLKKQMTSQINLL